MLKSLSHTNAPATIAAYMSIALTLYTLVPTLFVWQWPGGRHHLILAAMGVLGTAAHVVQTCSYRDGEVTLVEPSGYVCLVERPRWDSACSPRCPTAGPRPAVPPLSLAPPTPLRDKIRTAIAERAMAIP